MDKRLILAVAGAGKTSFIIDSLRKDKKSIILTYSDNNYENIREKIIEKFNGIPQNIYLTTYFNFLYSFCYKPFLHYRVKARGYNFEHPPDDTAYLKREDPRYYIDNYRRLYHNRLAKLIDVMKVNKNIIDRLEKYFDELYIDEVQDFAGHDFNLLLDLSKSNIKIMFVGDFYQYTFDTSRDGNVNKNLHKDYKKYTQRFSKLNFKIDKSTLIKSYRCSRSLCLFINNKMGINIESHKDNKTLVELLEEKNKIEDIIQDDKIPKLFFWNSKKYNCFSMNWGESKGIDNFKDVCVILNKSTYQLFKKDKLIDMNPKSKNKLYVACTRANNDLFFVPEKLIKSYLK